MNKDYRFEVYTDYSGYGDKVFVVRYYDLENVIGVGDTIEEAIEEAKGNLEVYLEYCEENNISVPEPTMHEDLDYSGKITVRMSKTLHKLVDERAKKEGISINLFLNEAILQYVSSVNTSEKIINESVEKISANMQEAFEELYNYPNLREQLENNRVENLWTLHNNLKLEIN
ncbi:MAG: toxin-antitoxin system HicB family antitoxin [Acholeplasmatales bacterium]|nr:toxin-antitoxin system HicB family antitoxin [Acholeplasmatales bacterium]